MMAIGAFLSPLSVMTSCSDWADHYENVSGGSNPNSLYEEIASHEELSDFAVLLANTKVFRHHKVTETSYADILSGGQSLTLMAPVNGTYNIDSLLQVLETAQGDSSVENFVVKNHIIRSPHSAVEGRYKALNGKYVDIAPFEDSFLKKLLDSEKDNLNWERLISNYPDRRKNINCFQNGIQKMKILAKKLNKCNIFSNISFKNVLTNACKYSSKFFSNYH
jgi:hypothetical protein